MFLTHLQHQIMVGSIYIITLVIGILVGAWPAAANQVTCATKLTPWSCRLTDGKMIDLKPVSSGNPPAFKAQSSKKKSNYVYQWDPVNKFPCARYSVAGCQTDNGENVFPIGDQETATFKTDNTGLYLSYTTSSKEGGRSLRVNLVCDHSKEKDFTAMGEVPTEGSKKYKMILTSKYACPKVDGGLSLGSILLIIVAILLVVYLVVGAIINIFVRQKSGLDAIPNCQVWIMIPGLIKDGCLFVYHKARGQPSSYQSL